MDGSPSKQYFSTLETSMNQNQRLTTKQPSSVCGKKYYSRISIGASTRSGGGYQESSDQKKSSMLHAFEKIVRR